jgi:hypothetical protein
MTYDFDSNPLSALREIFTAYEDLPGYFSELTEKDYDDFVNVLHKHYVSNACIMY